MINRHTSKMLLLLVASSLVSFSHGTKEKVTAQHKKTESYRKFNTAAFFQSLANTCAQASTTASAQTAQEKQQAACNLVSSIFQTAAVLSEKTNKPTKEIDRQGLSPAQTVLMFLQYLTPQDRKHCVMQKYPILNAILAQKNSKEQEAAITQALANNKDRSTFLAEIFSYFEDLLDIKLPIIFETLHTQAC